MILVEIGRDSPDQTLTMDVKSALEKQAKVAEFLHKHRIGLLTLMFTDIIGSTRLKQELGDVLAVSLIQEHHAVVREGLRNFGEAEEIETAGDSFFIVFAKPSDAAKFALKLQGSLRALALKNGRDLSDRIGIHIGEVVIEENPGQSKALYGMQVDTCARVMSMGEAGQILLTRAAFDNARQVLKGQDLDLVDELVWLSHGQYLFKGVEEPVEVCEVGKVGKAPLRPPPDSEKAKRSVSSVADPIPGWRPSLSGVVPNTRWQIQRKLGEGAFGEVWQAWHPGLQERRVFKFCFQTERARSLKREVTLFRVIRDKVGNHPNLVRLFDVNLDELPYYLEAEYVEGLDLKTWCQAQGGLLHLALVKRLEIVAQVAEGLQAAHTLGIVHRDIKPSNVLIHEVGSGCPQVKVADFGIGKIVTQEFLGEATRTGFTRTIQSERKTSISGTMAYLAPELLTGVEASSQSDIYSLGVLLYQMILGDFNKPLTIDWDQGVKNPLLRSVLQKCCAGDRQQRLARADHLAKELRLLLQHPKDLERTRSSAKLAILGAVGLACVISIFLLWFRTMPLNPTAASSPGNDPVETSSLPDLTTTYERHIKLRVGANEPGASVRLDGKLVGSTPREVDLNFTRAGSNTQWSTHMLRVEKPEYEYRATGLLIGEPAFETNLTFEIVQALNQELNLTDFRPIRFFQVPMYRFRFFQGVARLELTNSVSSKDPIDALVTDLRQFGGNPRGEPLIVGRFGAALGSYAPSKPGFVILTLPVINPVQEKAAEIVGTQIYLLNASGSSTPVTDGDPGVYDFDPCITKDGRTVYYSSDRGGQRGIWKKSVSGQGRSPVDPGRGVDVEPSVFASSEGLSRVVFTRYSLRAAVGTPPLLVVQEEGRMSFVETRRGRSPSWSNDGTKIAYVSPDNKICIMDANGENNHVLTSGKTVDDSPVWLPGDQQVLYASATSPAPARDGTGNFDLWRVDLSGNLEQMQSNLSFNGMPAITSENITSDNKERILTYVYFVSNRGAEGTEAANAWKIFYFELR